MLLDDICPKYDFTEVHTIRINATAEVAYHAILNVTLGEISPIVRLLFGLRTLPEKAVGRKGYTLGFDIHKSLLGQMLNNGFVAITESPPREYVFGLIVPGNIGRVWKKSSDQSVVPANAAEFLTFSNPNYLQVIANFTVDAAPESGFVVVRTESRTHALSEASRKGFRPYWWVIRPWSGLIRRLWLKAIKRCAEKPAA